MLKDVGYEWPALSVRVEIRVCRYQLVALSFSEVHFSLHLITIPSCTILSDQVN